MKAAPNGQSGILPQMTTTMQQRYENHIKTLTSAQAFEILRRPVPTTVDTSNPSDEIEISLHSLRFLTVWAMINPRQTQTQRRTHSQAFNKHWLTLWTWTSALSKHFILGKEPLHSEKGLEIRKELFCLYPPLFALPREEPEKSHKHNQDVAFSFAQRKADIFPILIQVWVYAVEDYPLESERILRTLHVVITSSHKSEDSGLPERLAIIFSRTSGAIALLFWFIDAKLSCTYPSTNYHPLGYAIDILANLAANPSVPRL
ncbi:hypothetical protein D9758_007110 [Tetrapyrgos nigripes]|uniref:Uncharacterized protein n=1 Tax=Tetrapyrgos nigripes TaxID=182062 RepID=A0A8H5GDK8_9AGAR|nr:hypothetical protein D9758_007110 [Tetrapyrgos nigripes]